ncbi:MAG: diaminopimelate epimerase [Lachnospiraceae bacterium]
MKFYKYDGLGNDYLVYDTNKNAESLSPCKVQKICNRNFGIGSDGILEGPYKENGKLAVKIWNPDGSVAEKSGNGVRIFSKYLKDAGYVKDSQYTLHTLGGDVSVRYNNAAGTNITVSMGTLDFSREAVGAMNLPENLINVDLVFGRQIYASTCVSIGNPHCVIPLDEVSKEKVCEIGAYSETSKYFPNRINTQIVKVLDCHNIQIEIFERGAGYTLASGSSSCAAAGATTRLGLTKSPVCVHMPGGELKIEIDEQFSVQMTGEVEYIGKMEMFESFDAENF